MNQGYSVHNPFAWKSLKFAFNFLNKKEHTLISSLEAKKNIKGHTLQNRETDMSGGVEEEKILHTSNGKKKPQSQRFFLTFRQLNALAGMIVLSAMGMPNLRVFGEKNRLQSLYVLFSGIISLVFPSAYILEGMFRGYKEDVRIAASHVFLLASQILMEGVAFYGGFSMPVFVFVPVFYNSRRIFTVVEWLKSEFNKTGYDPRRLYMGRGLAVVNMAFWCFNLFGFLLPVFLPRVFKVYYSSGHKDEH